MKLRIRIYEIDLMEMDEYFIDWFANKNETPLPIKSINGTRITHSDKHSSVHTKSFPNPITTEMLMDLHYNPKHVNTKFTSRIIEYYDKKGQPIVYLYPDGRTNISVEKINSTMNHLMRRNLEYQIQLRKNMTKNTKQK